MHHHGDTKLAKTKSFVVGKTGQWHRWLRFQEKRDARLILENSGSGDHGSCWWSGWQQWGSVSAPYLNREISFGIAAVHLGTSALRITENYHYTTVTHYIFSCRKLLSPKYRCETGIHVYGTPTICQALHYTCYMWNQIEGLGKDPSWTMFSKNTTFLKSINPVQVWTVYAAV